jgi:hypothetical protein
MLSSYMLIVRSILAWVFSHVKLVECELVFHLAENTHCIVQTTIIAVSD